MFIGNVNRTRIVFAFCFVLESCKHQAGKIERLYVCLVQQKTQQGLQGSANNTIPKHSAVYTSTPPRLQDPPFRFFRGSGSETVSLWSTSPHNREELISGCFTRFTHKFGDISTYFSLSFRGVLPGSHINLET